MTGGETVPHRALGRAHLPGLGFGFGLGLGLGLGLGFGFGLGLGLGLGFGLGFGLGLVTWRRAACGAGDGARVES